MDGSIEPMPEDDHEQLAEQFVKQAGADRVAWSARTGCSPG